MFGQLSHVGISLLILDPDLINALCTEAQLNRVIEYEGMVDAWDGKPHVDDTVADVFFDNMMGTPLNNVQEAAVDGEEVTVDAGEKVATINAQEVTGVNRDLFWAAAASACAVAGGSQNNNESLGNSDEDDKDLTLDQMGQHLQRNESNLKTTGDKNFTTWQVLQSEMSESAIVDCDYLQWMRLKEKVPIAYCMNIKNITKI